MKAPQHLNENFAKKIISGCQHSYQKCDSPVVSDKTRFPTLARTQPPATHSVTSVIGLMKFYKWAKFSIIVEKIDLMPRAGLSLQSLARANNMTVNHFVNITGPYSPLIHSKELQTAIRDTYKTTRSEYTHFLDSANTAEIRLRRNGWTTF
ncbi:guanylate cyclase [Elysia marginata]|uniref:Guanylate cyclase n=1 Tax=Elysia marginata TaxID=1093978 RepID=A0AAV4GX43_9GAST|nr:guanylate cyclase [Elysia marginata]